MGCCVAANVYVPLKPLTPHGFLTGAVKWYHVTSRLLLHCNKPLFSNTLQADMKTFTFRAVSPPGSGERVETRECDHQRRRENGQRFRGIRLPCLERPWRCHRGNPEADS